MLATRKDYILVGIIGLLVGLLVQPILSNTIENVKNVVGAPAILIRITALAFFVFLAPVALGVASFIGRKLAVVYQFAKFAAVGSLNSFIDLGIFNTLSYFFAGGGLLGNFQFFTFKSISFLAGTTNSYFWNKNWTFGDKGESRAATVIEFYLITGINYLLNTGVATGVNAIGPLFGVPGNVWSNVLAPIAGILAAMFANFFSYKYIVFKKAVGGDNPA